MRWLRLTVWMVAVPGAVEAPTKKLLLLRKTTAGAGRTDQSRHVVWASSNFWRLRLLPLHLYVPWYIGRCLIYTLVCQKDPSQRVPHNIISFTKRGTKHTYTVHSTNKSIKSFIHLLFI